MTLRRFKLKLNTWTFVEYFDGKKEFPLLTLSLNTPIITLPFCRMNEFTEWERLFCVSAPTLILWSKCNDISWEASFRVLGFGIGFCYQYGY